MLFGGGVGAALTAADTYQAYNAGNYNQVAFNLGTLGGGLLVGYFGGGGQLMANLSQPNPMQGVWNPITLMMHEPKNIFWPVWLGGESPFISVGYLSTAPTATSGAATSILMFGWVHVGEQLQILVDMAFN